MQAFELMEQIQRQQESGYIWFEFLKSDSLSMGIYTLPAGATDLQSPHTEDEVYYIVQGRAVIQVDGEDRPVQTGSLVYVAANVAHHFHSIEEEISALVFFAPPEGSVSEAPAL